VKNSSTKSLGTVKWFNITKGCGFITPENGGKDIFVHITTLEKARIKNLNEGQKVSFTVAIGKNGKEAVEFIELA